MCVCMCVHIHTDIHTHTKYMFVSTYIYSLKNKLRSKMLSNNPLCSSFLEKGHLGQAVTFFFNGGIHILGSCLNSETLSITTQGRLLPYWQLFLYGWQVSMSLNMNKI